MADRKMVLYAMAAVTVVSLATTVWLATKRGDWRPGGAAGPFGQGRQLVTDGAYADAIPLLERYLGEHPAGRNASRACLFLGKAHAGLGDLDAARRWFERGVRDFPATLEGHKCRYKLALVDLWEGRKDAATAGFAALAARPDGPLAPEAAAMHAWLTRGAGPWPLVEAPTFP